MNVYKRQLNPVSSICFSLMSTRQKRPRQGSSSQPTKKPFLDVQNQGSSSQPSKTPSLDVKKQGSSVTPTYKLKSKPERILKPNLILTNRGEQQSAHPSNGNLFLISEPCLLTVFEAHTMDIDALHAETSTRLSDYKSTLIMSAPPPAKPQAATAKLMCMYSPPFCVSLNYSYTFLLAIRNVTSRSSFGSWLYLLIRLRPGCSIKFY